MIHFSVLTIELGVTINLEENLTCNFLLYPSILFVVMFFYPFFFRSYFLLFQHHAQAEKAKRLFGWYTSNKLYSSLKFNLPVYFGVAILYLLIGIAIQYSSPNPQPFITTNKCISKQIYLVLVEAATIIIVTTVMVYKLWHVTDAFYIKHELRFALAICVPPAILWGLFMITDDIFPSWFKSSWLVIASIFCGYAAAIGFPIFVIYYHRHKLQHRGLRPRAQTNSRISVVEKDRMRDCFDDPILYEAFQHRCQEAWAIESLLFYHTYLEFQRDFMQLSQEERLQKVTTIYNDFIKVDSVLEVNLDMPVREAIFEELNHLGPDGISFSIFDAAERTVYSMLRYGVFKEWSITQEFENLYSSRFGKKSLESKGSDLTVSIGGE